MCRIGAHHLGISFICPKIGRDFCTPCINMPQIPGRLLHTVQRYAPDFRQTYAHRAVICLRFQADFCTPCSDMPQISGRLMHTGHRYAPDSGQIYAPRAMTCPRFEADLCTPCNAMLQISGMSRWSRILYLLNKFELR